MQLLRLVIATSLLATTMLSSGPLSALPLSPAGGGAELASDLGPAFPTIEVRHSGAGVAAGIIGGMVLGGIIASQAPRYYYPPPYAYYPAYPAGSAIAYCARRFRSYDPLSMTYLGYDGFRHPCP
jgi:BA14K-like protein